MSEEDPQFVKPVMEMTEEERAAHFGEDPNRLSRATPTGIFEVKFPPSAAHLVPRNAEDVRRMREELEKAQASRKEVEESKAGNVQFFAPSVTAPAIAPDFKTSLRALLNREFKQGKADFLFHKWTNAGDL